MITPPPGYTRTYTLVPYTTLFRSVSRSKLLTNSSLKPATPTRGEKVIRFIERYCRVPEGMKVGQPIRLDWFQKHFILDVRSEEQTSELQSLMRISYVVFCLKKKLT